jgi:radical SAM protein with 4Fe4S-binding SPASM domain
MDGSPQQEKFSVSAGTQRVYWYVSRRCNLACEHCWLNCSPYVDTSKELSTQEALAAVAKIKSFSNSAVLTGGEALFRPDFLLLLEAMIDARIHTVLETNGLLISERLVELLQQAKGFGLRAGISISLDGGTKAAHERVRGGNTFERTLAAMQMLKDACLDFDVQCILHRQNVVSIGALFEQMARYAPRLNQLIFGFLNPVGRGLQLNDFSGMTSAGRAEAYRMILEGMSWYPGRIYLKVPPALIPPQHFGRLFRQRNRWRCSATCAFPVLGILPDGHITVCALTGDDPSLHFGNIRTDSLTRIWYEARMDALRQRYVAAKMSGICSDCIFSSYCKGSCRAYAYEEFGSFSSPFPLCDALHRSDEFPREYRISKTRGQAAQSSTTTGEATFLREYLG